MVVRNPTGKGGQKKGEPSRNPSGRPKKVKEIEDLARAHAPDIWRRVVQLAASADERVSLAACQEVLNRAYGKPTQRSEVDATVRTSLVTILSSLGDGERAAEDPDMAVQSDAVH